MTYQELKAALELYQLGERVTHKQIKARHRELVKCHHPDLGYHHDEGHHSDQGCDTDPEIIRKINAAYEILTAECESYRYCFTEEEFLEQVPEERLRRQFGWDPIWSGDSEPEQD
jgi:DnaJ-class molecular chaperone